MNAVDRFWTETLEFHLQLVGQPIDILLIGLIVPFEAIGEARRHQTERRRQHRFVQRAPHHVAAGAEGAEGVAVVALAACDEVRALRLADLDKVLSRELKRGLGALRAGRAEIRMRQAAGFAVENDMREVLRRLAAERSGVRVGHAGGLPPDRRCDALVAVAETGDRGTTGAVDDLRAVGQV